MKVNIGGKYYNTDDSIHCSVKGCHKNLENEQVYSYATFGIKFETGEHEGQTHHVTICSSCYENQFEKKLARHVIDDYYTEVAVSMNDDPEKVLENIKKKEKERYHPSFLQRLKNIITLHKSAQ